MRKNTSPQKECVEMITSKKKINVLFFLNKKKRVKIFQWQHKSMI